MNSQDNPFQVLIADDDEDDCLLFKEALEELPVFTNLTTVHDGEQLMQLLKKKIKRLPNILFLDLNIPRKNGLECLTEIKHNQKLEPLFVIILSTSSEQEIINLLYAGGAQYYIRKPSDYSILKKVISQALAIIGAKGPKQPLKEKFILTGD